MTRPRNGGVQRRARKPRRRIPDRSPGHAFVRMTRWVAGMTRVGIYSRTNDAHETGPLKSEQLRFSPTLDFGEPNLLP